MWGLCNGVQIGLSTKQPVWFSNPFSMIGYLVSKNVWDNAAALIIPRQACAAHNTWLPNPVRHISIFGRHFLEALTVPRCTSADRVAMAVYQLWLQHWNKRMLLLTKDKILLQFILESFVFRFRNLQTDGFFAKSRHDWLPFSMLLFSEEEE